MTEAAFWDRVIVLDMDDCWEWSGPRQPRGYGYLSFEGRYWLAHRLAWRLTYGFIEEGFLVCHHCDNPPCLNLSHLFAGTQADNMLDMKTKSRRKGRGVGEANGRARLSTSDVIAIRGLCGSVRQIDIAKRFGISQSMVSAIATGVNWRHL